ncbi:putative dehydrogenase [Motilibacter peucedani]|uniref:Putative dehydrogenase n=1 Tax=Motilibacter peucedani TaxID=598650 RepID=A0A420XMS5_9ACTN|nr:Gfo/Idh/MocA family oxidoreductase [Motilibacter peucedani]RKS72584.1 putative dehydrogenase [Motilibacter peucedani]
MTLRFGLVGTGQWARRTHGASLAAHLGAELAGVWGRDPGRAAALAEELGAPAYADADALFDAVDAVSFAVPPDVQAELAVRAAERGCHLLLDKPVAIRAELGTALAAAVARAGVSTVVFFTRRFVPETERWIARLSATGGWTGAHAEWVASLPPELAAQSPWRREQGALWDIGPHVLSLLLPVLGPVSSVAAYAGPGDTTHLALRHAGGASSTATVTLTAPPEAVGQELRFYGSAGRETAPAVRFDAAECHAHAVDALLAAVGGVPSELDLGFGLAVGAVLTSAARSRSTGGAEVRLG